MAFGKTNAKGRSTGVMTRKEKNTFGPPKDRGWVWQTTEMMFSPAWKAMGINTRRLIDFLEIEHRNHAGIENGNLMATYDQLVDFGISRSEISRAVKEAEYLGFIDVKRGGRWADTYQPSVYRLTFYATKDWVAPTNNWKGKTEEAIKKWKRSRSKQKLEAKEFRKTNRGAVSRTTVMRLPELPEHKLKVIK